MADERTLRVDVKGKGRVNTSEESSAWESRETDPGECSRDTEVEHMRECDQSSAPLFSLEMYLSRSSSAASSSTDTLSSQRSDMGVDCAGIILNCLFCRFYDLILMLPDSCERVAYCCCPNSKRVVTALESTANKSDDDSHADWDFGLFTSCHDAGDCLELAMEMSELCYH
ncbi:uncharacterized protein V6R79_017507 [Siganus canaliculatus]